jgi:predicted MFS family arabinose efflux permease
MTANMPAVTAPSPRELSVPLAVLAAANYRTFLALRAVGGAGWAMFATVATTITVGMRASERRGRAVSLF